MNFYRLATKEDFDKDLLLKYDAYSEGFINNEIKLLIENGKLPQAAETMRKITGISVYDCKGYCEQYLTFYRAKCDFDNGLPVYTDY